MADKKAGNESQRRTERGIAKSVGAGVGSTIGGAAGLASGLSKWTRDVLAKQRSEGTARGKQDDAQWVWWPWRKRS
jgi:hypothetical protein